MRVNTFEFLTPGDWELLLAKAQTRHYVRGATILEGGAYSRAIFLIEAGLVRIEQAEPDGAGRGISLGQLGPGEVFGELAFLDGSSASASIIAEADVRVRRVDDAHLQALLGADPSFAARFYQSLAVSLSHKLRRTSRRLLQLSVGEVAQVNRYHNPRTGNLSPRQIPAELVAEVEAVQRAWQAVEADLRAGRLAGAPAQAQVNAACDQVPALLATHTQGDSLMEMGWDDLLAFRDTPQLESGVGDYVFRATFASFMLSATIARCYTKPRGFADDFETIEMMYRAEPEGDDRLGPYIDQWFLARPLCEARRSSRRYLAGLLREALAAGQTETLCVTSLGSGAARELFDLYGADPRLDLDATCLDLDERALAAGNQRAEALGVNDRMAFVQANVVSVAQGQSDLSLSPQRVIYALGLCDYLTDDEVRAMLDWAHAHLRPGGQVILTNLDPRNPDRQFMEHILEWKLYHRAEAELRALFDGSRFGGAAAARLEPSGNNWFVTGQKAEP